MNTTNNKQRPAAVVTVGRRFQPQAVILAKKTAAELNLPYFERGRESYQSLREKYGTDFILVAKNGTLTLDTPQGELFFHPGMAHNRIRNLCVGKSDYLVEALGLKQGMSVLDCTLGPAADALVAAVAVGETGRVVGLEINPLVATVIGYGLSHNIGENYTVHAAMRRIEVKNVAHEDFLRTMPDNSFDAVYFDPMFRHPFEDSVSLSPLRTVAEKNAVTDSAVAEAKRVAKHRVVIKESSLSQEFARLGFTDFVGGKYSRIKYGVWKKEAGRQKTVGSCPTPRQGATAPPAPRG